MAICKKCGNPFPDRRKDLGYSNCVSCSTESKWAGVPLIHHKTGNCIQIIKDPEVAEEFIAKSKRAGFGAMRGMTGAWKKPLNPGERRKKQIRPEGLSSLGKVIAKKEVKREYRDEEIGEQIVSILDTQGPEIARETLEKEFQAMAISPDCRKRILHLINFSTFQ